MEISYCVRVNTDVRGDVAVPREMFSPKLINLLYPSHALLYNIKFLAVESSVPACLCK